MQNYKNNKDVQPDDAVKKCKIMRESYSDTQSLCIMHTLQSTTLNCRCFTLHFCIICNNLNYYNNSDNNDDNNNNVIN